ncbi:MAG: DUF4168 domain-containing protein [Xanthobacteraceae bacterium]
MRLLDAADEPLRPIAVGEDWGPRCVPNCSATHETKSICIRKETNMQRFMRFAARAAVIVWCGLLIPAAVAQTSSQPSIPQTSANIPDEKLDAAAAAMQRIASLQQNYRDQISAAPSADRNRIANEAGNALTKAVTDQGLSVDEYANIVDAAQSDLGVRQRILQRLRSLRDENSENHR